MKTYEMLDPPRTALLLGLLVGLGIALQPVFFLLAFVIALALLPVWFYTGAGRGAHSAES